MTGTVHNILKYWIIEEAKKKVDSNGNPVYKKAYSGDKQPIDVRKRKKSFTYHPDVVLVETKGKLYFIEIAFTEQWRPIIGELAVAKAAEADAIIFIVYSGVDGWKKGEIENKLAVVGEAIDFEKWYTFVLTEDESKDAEKAKNRLRCLLKEWI